MHKKRSTAWPFAGIAVGLITLTFVAAMWRQSTRPTPPGFAGSPALSDALPESSSIARASFNTDQFGAKRAIATVPTNVREAVDFSVDRRHILPVPPVADRISGDPSRAEVLLASDARSTLRLESTRRGSIKAQVRDLPVVAGVAAKLTRRGVHQSPDIATSWPYPAKLVESLALLGTDPTTARWAEQLRVLLEELH